mmetsp:Transcript_35691/g.83539  ORF Transcript_35691/g.83539 Transcript_35691/m.83539 type:complete len:282 (+) Transcript_35691:73-918(+)
MGAAAAFRLAEFVAPIGDDPNKPKPSEPANQVRIPPSPSGARGARRARAGSMERQVAEEIVAIAHLELDAGGGSSRRSPRNRGRQSPQGKDAMLPVPSNSSERRSPLRDKRFLEVQDAATQPPQANTDRRAHPDSAAAAELVKQAASQPPVQTISVCSAVEAPPPPMERASSADEGNRAKLLGEFKALDVGREQSGEMVSRSALRTMLAQVCSEAGIAEGPLDAVLDACSSLSENGEEAVSYERFVSWLYSEAGILMPRPLPAEVTQQIQQAKNASRPSSV